MKRENFKHNHENRRRAGEVGTKTCFVTKETLPRTDMLRFVCAPERVIVFDVAEKLPGRGFWLKADKEVLTKAVAQKIFYKAAKGTVEIPEDLVRQVETALKDRCLNLLGLCRKAGLLVFGFEAVKKSLEQGNVSAIFEAEDASERGQNKIIKPGEPVQVWSVLSRSDLGKISGLDEVVHVALLNGALSKQASDMARKISLYQNRQEQKG